MRLNTTNLHTHGLHVSPNGISDNVLLELDPQGVQEYEIQIPKDHPAGTFWYHAHRHGSTTVQVGSGMSGAIIIEGGMDAVPEIDKAKERIFILQQIAYCFNNELITPALKCENMTECEIELPHATVLFGNNVWPKLGRFTTINGDRLPVIRMQPGAVERWRFVHSGTREVVKLAVERSSQSVPPAPEKGAEYLLIDDSVPASEAIAGIAKSRRYLARIVIEGTPTPMAMPTDAQLSGFRLPSLGPPTEVVTDPSLTTIVYGPRDNNGDGTPDGPFLSIDGKQYDHNTA